MVKAAHILTSVIEEKAEEGRIIVIFAIAYCDYCCCSQVSMNDKRYSGNTKQQDPFLSNEKLHLEFNISCC